MLRAVLVGVAGAAGALARYGIGLAVGPRSFPVATLGINVAGSLVIGATLTAATEHGVSRTVSTAVAVGFLGAFTTFSTFSYETEVMLEAGHHWRAVAYVALSIVLGVAAAAGGVRLAHALG